MRSLQKMGKMNQLFFRELYHAISPYLEQEKKAFLHRSREMQIKSVTSNLNSSEVINNFINNLNVRPPKEPVVIALDPVDRILDFNPFILEVRIDFLFKKNTYVTEPLIS